jgi:hypothetical protein
MTFVYIKDLNGMNSSDVPLFSVSISDNCLDDVREKRSVFHSHMKSIGGKHADSTLKTSFHVTIGTQSETESRNEKVWFVLYFHYKAFVPVNRFVCIRFISDQICRWPFDTSSILTQ